MKATHFSWPSSQGCLGCIHAEAGSESSVTCLAAHKTPDCELRKYKPDDDAEIDLLIEELEEERNKQYPDLIGKISRMIASKCEASDMVTTRYPVDESQTVSNAGDAIMYVLDENVSIEIITWNDRAEEHEPGSITVSLLDS